MFTEHYEQFFKLNKIMSPVSELNKLTTDICKKNAEQQLELMNDNIARFSERLKEVSSIKKPEDLVNLQKEYITEDVNTGVETVQRLIKAHANNMENLLKVYGNVCESGLATVAKSAEKSKR